jgi:hypothetical protein
MKRTLWASGILALSLLALAGCGPLVTDYAASGVCPGGTTPGADGLCYANVQSAGCRSDADCGPGAICAGDGACYGPSGCRGNFDCAPGSVCLADGACSAVAGCSFDAECPPGTTCGADGACYAHSLCTSDSDCPPGAACAADNTCYYAD